MPCTLGIVNINVDIYYLLPEFTLGEMLEFYKKKYDQKNVAFILKSLIWFEDVDLADWPVLIDNPESKWGDVKKRLEKVVLDFARNT